MKICITSSGKNLNSPVDPRFGRSMYFLIVDEKTEKFEAIQNPATQAWQGAGIAAAQAIADKKVKVVITGNIGPNAFGALKTSGIKVFPGVFGMTARQALEMYKKGKLKSGVTPTVFGHSGMGPGSGSGRRGQGGFGRGGGGFGGRGRGSV